jgi:hypothetical protein
MYTLPLLEVPIVEELTFALEKEQSERAQDEGWRVLYIAQHFLLHPTSQVRLTRRLTRREMCAVTSHGSCNSILRGLFFLVLDHGLCGSSVEHVCKDRRAIRAFGSPSRPPSLLPSLIPALIRLVQL